MSTGYLVYELLAAQAGVLLVATVAVGLAALLVSLPLPGPPARARLDAEPGPRLVERPAWPATPARQAEPQPEIAALRKRHAKRPERFQAALLDLYRERGVGVLAGSGCLPLLLQLVQLPVMFVVYRVVRASAFTGALLGVPLGTTLLAAPPPVLLALVGVLAVLATLSAWQAGRTARRAAAATPGQPTARQAATLARVLPFAVIPMAAWLPLAVVVYLAAGNLFTVLQQAIARVH